MTSVFHANEIFKIGPNGSVLIKRKRDKKLRFFLIKSRILSKQNYSGIVLSHYYALVIFWKGCETQLPVIRRSLYTIITLRAGVFLCYAEIPAFDTCNEMTRQKVVLMRE